MSLRQHQILAGDVVYRTLSRDLETEGLPCQCPGCLHAANELFVAAVNQHEADAEFAENRGRCPDCYVRDQLMRVRIVPDGFKGGAVELAKENELLRAVCGHLCDKLDKLKTKTGEQ